MSPRTVCWFSAGAASAVATKIAIEACDGEIEVVYIDTASEHADNQRFADDCEKWFGIKITRLKSDKYIDIWDVWEKKKFIVSSYGASCTTELKKKVRQSFERRDDIQVFGYTAEESNRANRFIEQNPGVTLSTPLIDRKITKNDCYTLIDRAGIELPAMYQMGYNYNNCIGCPKGGVGYWNKIRKDFPDVFKRMLDLEQELDWAILNIKGKPVFLKDLDPTAGNHQEEISPECSVFCAIVDAEFSGVEPDPSDVYQLNETIVNKKYISDVPIATYGSLFSGVGGLDLGFDAAGLQCKWQVENNHRCNGIINKHWPDVIKYDDVRNVKGNEITPVDILAFGFPCQDLSNAGASDGIKVGFEGERSVLFFEAIRIIKEMREATDGIYPRYAVAENVVGLLSAEQGGSFIRVLESLVGLGAMAIEWRVLDAENFGVPQRRRRVFLVADFDPGAATWPSIYPQPKSLRRHSKENAKPKRPDTGTPPESSPGSSVFVSVGHSEYIEGDISPTLVASKHEREATLIAFSHNAGIDIGASELVAPTLKHSGTTASIYQKTGGDIQLRRLSPLECERLMGWPDGHTSQLADGTPLADTPRYAIIGNGIASPVAQWVATQIVQHHAQKHADDKPS